MGATEEALECRLAAALGERLDAVSRFGSGDCRCPGHLFLANDEKAAHASVRRSLESFEIEPYTIRRANLEEFFGL